MATIRCDICKREFDRPSHRNQHIKDAHKKEPMTTDSKQVADTILPPKPKAFGSIDIYDNDGMVRSVDGYTAEQMDAHVTEAVRAALARSQPQGELVALDDTKTLRRWAEQIDKMAVTFTDDRSLLCQQAAILLHRIAYQPAPVVQPVTPLQAPAQMQEPQPLCNAALRPAPASQHSAIVAGMQAAQNAEYPMPNSPHASVLQHARDNRTASRLGYLAAAKKADELSRATQAPTVGANPKCRAAGGSCNCSNSDAISCPDQFVSVGATAEASEEQLRHTLKEIVLCYPWGTGRKLVREGASLKWLSVRESTGSNTSLADMNNNLVNSAIAATVAAIKAMAPAPTPTSTKG